MITSFKTKLLFVALALLALLQPGSAQGGGVPVLGYYRPCIMVSKVEKAEIIKPKFESTVIVNPQIEHPNFAVGVMERPLMEIPKFVVPQMVRPQFVDPCVTVYGAMFSAVLTQSAVALGVKFDRDGRIAGHSTNDLSVAAMMPPGVATAMVSRTDAPKHLAAPAVNATCCGGAPGAAAPAAYTGMRVRTRE